MVMDINFNAPVSATYELAARFVVAIAVSLSIVMFSACTALPESTVKSPNQDGQPLSSDTGAAGHTNTDDEIAALFSNHRSDTYVTGAGVVQRILADDTEGDRHQRFILRLSSGQTLLIAHNIDIAPRAEPLKVGDEVRFAGIYEYNDEGGVIHWTHHDPDGEHQGGYIYVNGSEFS
jgi:hypothetical protein